MLIKVIALFRIALGFYFKIIESFLKISISASNIIIFFRLFHYFGILTFSRFIILNRIIINRADHLEAYSQLIFDGTSNLVLLNLVFN